MGTIKFPQFKRGKEGVRIHPGLTILELARISEVRINAECGGIGKCGKCIVRIEEGMENLGPLTHLEKKFKLKENERLACQAHIVRDRSDIVVYVKNFGEYEILKYGMEKEVPLCPLYYKKGSSIFKNGEEVDRYRGKIYGIALDIGTTTVVMDLVDLENGDILETVAKTNPQISYGNDVISRIEYTLVDKKTGKYFEEKERIKRAKQLQMLVVEQLNETIKELSKEKGEDISQYIYYTVAVGNSTMRNLFFGIDVSSLGIIPYEPEHRDAITKSPQDIGINTNKSGTVYGCALIGGHIGADIVADVIASGMYKDDEMSLLIDIGTNGEIVLGNKDRLISASCAAGGAFEGASVSCGIGGIEGAIKKIEIVDGRVAYSTIGDKYPIGVCGSGLIDLLAQLLEKGIMTKTARIDQDFYITGDLKITQNDIFQLITSKSAIRTGWEILLKYYPVKLADVKKVYLSGGFGNFIDVKNAMKIGLIPDIDVEKIIKIGNGALEGAREILLCKDARKLSEEIAEKVKHIRTNEIEKDFEYIMAENMYFK
ncbi:MAG TPA: ASKHA domain-containing protein [bacterium]|nr:ASKHA domain-containing protein [bacterium]HPP30034.1 ASKHA domain-containing protein [bacterium]